MFKAIKNAWNTIKTMVNKATSLPEESTRYPAKRSTVSTSTRNWAEYIEHVRMAHRANEYVKEQIKEEIQLTQEQIEAWRENNRMVSQYFSNNRNMNTAY